MPTSSSRPLPESVSVSVIIPTYNAGSAFGELLSRLCRQTLSPFEIIVVDSSSTDGTVETAKRAGASVHVIKQSTYDHGGTRNFAASLAKGEILVFMTQDAVPNDEFMLEQLVRSLEDKSVGCVYGRQLAQTDASLLEKLTREFNYPAESFIKEKSDLPQMGLKTFFYSNVLSAVPKYIFYQLDRFPEPVIFNEDLFFSAKCILQGYKVFYNAEAKVVHSHNYSLLQTFRRYFDNGVSMRNNKWIYQYSGVGKAGSNLVKSLLKSLHVQQKWHWIPKLILESIVKYAGYQLGKRHVELPSRLCQSFSMHRNIWSKIYAGKPLVPGSHNSTDTD